MVEQSDHLNRPYVDAVFSQNTDESRGALSASELPGVQPDDGLRQAIVSGRDPNTADHSDSSIDQSRPLCSCFET